METKDAKLNKSEPIADIMEGVITACTSLDNVYKIEMVINKPNGQMPQFKAFTLVRGSSHFL